MSSLLMCQPANETAKQLYLDDRDRSIYLDGMRSTLTEQEYLLLSELAQHAGEAVSRQDLLRKAWGYLSPGDTRTVDDRYRIPHRLPAPGAPRVTRHDRKE